MQIGIFTKIFPRPSLELALDAVLATGLRCVQFNMESVGLPPMPDEVPARLAENIRVEVTARGLAIASVQGTFNMSHPDPEHRRAGLHRLRGIAARSLQNFACTLPRLPFASAREIPENMWRRHADNDTPEALA